MKFKEKLKRAAKNAKNVTTNGVKRVGNEFKEVVTVGKELIQHIKDRDRVHTFDKIKEVSEEAVDVVEAVDEEVIKKIEE